jgi:hypothetical protein
MRLSVASLRRVVKGDLTIQFVPQALTSYGGPASPRSTPGEGAPFDRMARPLPARGPRPVLPTAPRGPRATIADGTPPLSLHRDFPCIARRAGRC